MNAEQAVRGIDEVIAALNHQKKLSVRERKLIIDFLGQVKEVLAVHP